MKPSSMAAIAILWFLWTPGQVLAAGIIEPYEDSGNALSFNLQDLNGRSHKLEDYRGKVLLVNFWASWCPPCIREFPSLERLSRAMDTSRFTLLAINVGEGKGTVQRFQRLQDAGIKMLMDKNGVAAGSWGVNVYPSSFIVDTNGVIQESFIGETDWDDEEKHASIKALFSVNTDK